MRSWNSESFRAVLIKFCKGIWLSQPRPHWGRLASSFGGRDRLERPWGMIPLPHTFKAPYCTLYLHLEATPNDKQPLIYKQYSIFSTWHPFITNPHLYTSPWSVNKGKSTVLENEVFLPNTFLSAPPHFYATLGLKHRDLFISNRLFINRGAFTPQGDPLKEKFWHLDESIATRNLCQKNMTHF